MKKKKEVLEENETKAEPAGEEVLHHGQQKHGSSDFPEDVREGLRAKIRDQKSSRIRSRDAQEAEQPN